MLQTTGWALRTWAKLTLLLALIVGAVWLLADGPGWVWTALVLACVAECYLIRQLAREWSWQARGTWWWTR